MHKILIFILLMTILGGAGCQIKGQISEIEDENNPGYIIGENDDRLTVDQFLGVNGFSGDPIDKLEVAGAVREYHLWNWNEGKGVEKPEDSMPYPLNKIRFNFPNWDLDEYYSELNTRGIFIVPCIMNSVKWMNSDLKSKPLPEGSDPLAPSSYIAHAHFMFQYAARYGSQVVDKENLTLSVYQKRVSGLNLIQYYENWNEPDGWWKKQNRRFTPEEYAAMSSADRDGDMGRLGKNIGIKNADPNAKLVMGGLSGFYLDYVEGIKKWCDVHRNGDFVFDVLNFHDYCNDNPNIHGLGHKGVSPEEADLKNKLEKVVRWRDDNLPGKEVWYSEFGYDTNQNSPQKAPTIGQLTPEMVQGIWIIRSFLIAMDAGVDRAFMYMSRDVNPQSKTQFASSGLTGPKGNWTPKASWYYMNTFKSTLKGMIFNGEKESGNNEVVIYSFRNKEDVDGGAYVVWMNTSADRHIDSFEFSINPQIRSAKMVTLKKGKTEGDVQTLECGNGKVTLPIGESPTILLVDRL